MLQLATRLLLLLDMDKDYIPHLGIVDRVLLQLDILSTIAFWEIEILSLFNKDFVGVAF